VLLLLFISVERGEGILHALSFTSAVRAMHVPDRQDWELAKSVRVSERGEQALLELPGAVRSLSEKLPALSVVVRIDRLNFGSLTLLVLLPDYGNSFAK